MSEEIENEYYDIAVHLGQLQNDEDIYDNINEECRGYNG